jgi:hypothetical protein
MREIVGKKEVRTSNAQWIVSCFLWEFRSQIYPRVSGVHALIANCGVPSEGGHDWLQTLLLNFQLSCSHKKTFSAIVKASSQLQGRKE